MNVSPKEWRGQKEGRKEGEERKRGEGKIEVLFFPIRIKNHISLFFLWLSR